MVLHPAVAHLPDLKTSWNDIAILLARSTVQGQVLEDLRSRLGHPRAELMSYFKKRVSRKELLSLKEILELEKSLMKPRWTKWASVLRSWNLEPFQQFEEIRDKLNKVYVNVGSDVKDLFKSLLDTIKIIASIVPKGA